MERREAPGRYGALGAGFVMGPARAPHGGHRLPGPPLTEARGPSDVGACTSRRSTGLACAVCASLTAARIVGAPALPFAPPALETASGRKPGRDELIYL